MALVNSTTGGGGGITQLSYVEFTAGVTVSSTTEATPTDVVDAAALTFNGSTLVCVEFYSPQVFPNAASNSLVINLWDGATNLGKIAVVQESAASGLVVVPVLVRRYLTPSAASHTFKIQAWMSAGTGTIQGGAGGAGNNLPGYIRVTSGS